MMVASTPSHSRYGKFEKDGATFVGELVGDEVFVLDASGMCDVMANRHKRTGGRHRLSDLRVLQPVDRPSKIICIGLNYRSHISEMKWETPKAPIIFTKPSSALVGPDQDIVLPEVSSRVDFEGESAIVIGRRAWNTSDGAASIFGYTCLNDVTARDLQKADVDWTRAKGFDTFAPVGPFVSTKPPTRVQTRLNGKTVQDAPLSDRVFGDAELVEYISSIMTLEPGDIIATGTPSGIAPMSAGDVVEVELDGIGTLKNRVVSQRR